MEMVLTCTCIGGMEMLVCGGGSGEGYHVLFCWNYWNYCCFVNELSMRCRKCWVHLPSLGALALSALGWVVEKQYIKTLIVFRFEVRNKILSIENPIVSGYLNNFLPPILAAALSLPSRLNPVNPTVPPYCAFLYLRSASRK